MNLGAAAHADVTREVCEKFFGLGDIVANTNISTASVYCPAVLDYNIPNARLIFDNKWDGATQFIEKNLGKISSSAIKDLKVATTDKSRNVKTIIVNYNNFLCYMMERSMNEGGQDKIYDNSMYLYGFLSARVSSEYERQYKEHPEWKDTLRDISLQTEARIVDINNINSHYFNGGTFVRVFLYQEGHVFVADEFQDQELKKFMGAIIQGNSQLAYDIVFHSKQKGYVNYLAKQCGNLEKN